MKMVYPIKHGDFPIMSCEFQGGKKRGEGIESIRKI